MTGILSLNQGFAKCVQRDAEDCRAEVYLGGWAPFTFAAGKACPEPHTAIFKCPL